MRLRGAGASEGLSCSETDPAVLLHCPSREQLAPAHVRGSCAMWHSFSSDTTARTGCSAVHSTQQEARVLLPMLLFVSPPDICSALRRPLRRRWLLHRAGALAHLVSSRLGAGWSGLLPLLGWGGRARGWGVHLDSEVQQGGLLGPHECGRHSGPAGRWVGGGCTCQAAALKTGDGMVQLVRTCTAAALTQAGCQVATKCRQMAAANCRHHAACGATGSMQKTASSCNPRTYNQRT